MNHSELEKVTWEKQAIDVFIQWYNSHHTDALQFLTHNLPAKPDVSCLLDHKPVDIEIAHLYGSTYEAKKILGKELNANTREELTFLEQKQDVDSRLVEALNRILMNKSTKSYDSECTWLVIRNAHPAWNSRFISRFTNLLVIPKGHPFEKIWIIGDIDAQSGVLQLFPNQQNGCHQ
ncbi:MAG: hypothetical protein Alis3KO_04650 [Aliiglaciecola sp.]